MATEIERKFLVLNKDWREHISSQLHIVQGYLASNEFSSTRIRIQDDKANINIKSATLGITRTEFEYAIPVVDAQSMINELCIKPVIEKTRYTVKHMQHLWEIDVFSGENEGLIVAEVELSSSDEAFEKPSWIGEEVSNDTRYYNVCLVDNPYKTWTK
ncbi:MAG: CYTH domain-containing protein [Gammaproteobacteria bacterium]|nr:CYTH domain-containing protein [Gammaproteobacteria bacterium]MCK5497575.1 CYTH domain-containing protein [Gammaproteobacteria bacterium]